MALQGQPSLKFLSSKIHRQYLELEELKETSINIIAESFRVLRFIITEQRRRRPEFQLFSYIGQEANQPVSNAAWHGVASAAGVDSATNEFRSFCSRGAFEMHRESIFTCVMQCTSF
ncbi:hypothetical protein EVAR_7788_1 [Eumeta japonica]|uniref:Uncharacterized protein n=1 Tax=Eumeta variegata TaxID=151549 RepID=A0A4C1TKD1_EUMVA|nr:hypothetical protein EVAR_7788_1 [Eumeta japonica]